MSVAALADPVLRQAGNGSFAVFHEGERIGSVWRSNAGTWGYTHNDCRDGFAHLSRGGAAKALVRHHLRGHGARARPPSRDS
jgi:hypothetical protein